MTLVRTRSQESVPQEVCGRFLTIIAIFMAFLIYGVLATFQNAMNAGIDRRGADRLIVTNKINFTLPMPIAYVQRTRQVKGVKTVTHANWFGGYYRDSEESSSSRLRSIRKPISTSTRSIC